MGRQDATAADPDGRMPALDSSAQQLIDNFAGKGEQLWAVVASSHGLLLAVLSLEDVAAAPKRKCSHTTLSVQACRCAS